MSKWIVFCVVLWNIAFCPPLFSDSTGTITSPKINSGENVTNVQEGAQQIINYENKLQVLKRPPAILADFPDFVQPMQCERRYLSPPVVDEKDGELLVRSWRYWYNARGIVEMENRLEAKATAIILVHAWGIDDGHGYKTPEPAGIFFGTAEKNMLAHSHIQKVINPFLRRLRPHVALVGYSLPGKEDELRKLLYPSIATLPEKLDIEKGEKLLAERLKIVAGGKPLVSTLTLDGNVPVQSYFKQAPSIDSRYVSGTHFNLAIMPLSSAIDRGPKDVVFYDHDTNAYQKVHDHLKSLGIRHILLMGYATDMCLKETTCGYLHLGRHFNVFIVGDATLATFPGSTTPKYATQVALVNAALQQMITQVNWIKIDPSKTAPDRGGGEKR